MNPARPGNTRTDPINPDCAVNWFFFDIDGTLLLTGGAGRIAMQRVLGVSFENGNWPDLRVHGRTDRAIIADLFGWLDRELTDEGYREFVDAYHRELGDCIQSCSGRLLAGVAELLQSLSGRPGVAMGLLTGNSREAAATKVNHFGIGRHFEFGGYGDRHMNRVEVARDALESCRHWALPRHVDPRRAWVVGDTVHDVQCARAIGANVIGVATGGATRGDLELAGADLVLNDLTDRRPFFRICGLAGDP